MRKYQIFVNRNVMMMGVLFILLGCQQPMLDSGETKLKKLSEYHLNDFHFSKNVRYLEIIQHGRTPIAVARYGTNGNILKPVKIETFTSKKRVKYDSSYWKQVSKKLRGASYGMMVAPFYSVRYVNADGEEFMLSNISELKSLLGEIDTPAELQMWLFLSAKVRGYSYEKSNSFYNVKWYYHRINDTGMCTHYSHKGRVNFQGKIVKTWDSKSKLCSESQRKEIWE